MTSKHTDEDEPELRPEYIKKLIRIQKHGKYMKFSSLQELRDSIEKKKK
jgi:hypothetical protein